MGQNCLKKQQSKVEQKEEVASEQINKWSNQFEDDKKSDDPFAITLVNNFESGIKEEEPK